MVSLGILMTLKSKDSQACEAGDKFVKLYYDTFDRNRHSISQLYTEASTLSWNGIQVAGKANITRFFDELPPSKHIVSTIDAQPITAEVTAGQPTILVQTGGSVKYEGESSRMFSQTFTLTAQDNKWRVVADCVRVLAG